MGLLLLGFCITPIFFAFQSKFSALKGGKVCGGGKKVGDMSGGNGFEGKIAGKFGRWKR